MTFAIVHISDLHFGRTLKAPTSGFWRNRLGISEHSFPLVVSLSEKINELMRTFGSELIVMVTGDQTTSANAAAFDVVANFLNGRIFVAPGVSIGLELDGKAYVVPGNHDMFLRSFFSSRDRSTVYADYFPANFPSWRLWKSRLGYVTIFSLDSNRVSGFNFLNSRNLNQHGEIGNMQRGTLLALRETLKAHRDKTIPPDYDYDASFKIALLHHHLTEPDGQPANSDLRDARNVIDLLSEMKIDIALCGHEHYPFETRIGRPRPFQFSCAGSATKQDVRINSFKVYYVESFTRIAMEEFSASEKGGLHTFVRQPKVDLT